MEKSKEEQIEIMSWETAKSLQDVIDFSNTFCDTCTPIRVGEHIVHDIEPRDYQFRGIAWLWGRKRAMLTDEPGLGKTPQAAMAAKSPTLVVAPTYLVRQWEEWLYTHMYSKSGKHETVTNAMQGNRAFRSALIAKCSDWTVINKEMLRTHEEELKKRDWKTIIFDESHHLRNHTAALSKAAVKVANNVENVYLLTATPIWKEPDDLYMQFRIMHPEIFKSYYRFVDEWCYHESTRFGTKVMGARTDKLDELHELMDIMAYGRSYNEAGRELPALIEKTITLDFPPELKSQYDRVRDAYKLDFEGGSLNFTHFSQVLHTLRQITAYYGKIESICDFIEDTKSEGTLVFTWYQNLADQIAVAMRKRGMDVNAIHGYYPPDERLRRAHASKHVVATIESLSEGIDLSRMDTVIFAEEHWPPGSNIQALRRVQRDRQSAEGNERPVTVVHVHVRGTIDEHIHHVAAERTATIKDVIKRALEDE